MTWAVLPARRASKAPPVAAIRELARDGSGWSRRRAAIGAAVTAAGVAALSLGLLPDPKRLVLVGLGAAAIFVGVAVLGPVLAGPASRLLGTPLPALSGMPGTLARENAVRSPKRTAATAAALMIGVSLVAFTADFLIDTGSFAALDPSLTKRLARLPEVGPPPPCAPTRPRSTAPPPTSPASTPPPSTASSTSASARAASKTWTPTASRSRTR